MLCRSRDSALALRGRGHRPAYRLRILRCQIARYAEESMFGRRIHDRQLSPEQMVAAIRIDLVHHLDQRIVARDQYALLAIAGETHRSEEHTSELQSLMRISYAVFCLKKKKITYK